MGSGAAVDPHAEQLHAVIDQPIAELFRDLPLQRLEFRVDDQNVSLFILPAEQYEKLGLRDEPRFKMVNRSGYDVIVWSSHGVAYALVSEIGGRSCAVCHSPDERLDVTLKPEVHPSR